MADPYIVRNSRGEIVASIRPGTTNVGRTTLVLHGRGVLDYGLSRNQNLVYLLENFNNPTEPPRGTEGQLWWKTGDQMFVYAREGSPEATTWRTLVPSATALGFDVTAGAGLTGGGFPTLSPLEVVLDVGEGTGITVGADTISTNDAEIVHDNLLNFSANRHINHTSVVLTAGAGLTGGGDLTATRTFTVGAGDGIQVTVGGMNVDDTVVTVAGSPANQTIGGIKTFTSPIRNDSTNDETQPAYGFASDPDTGFYRVSSDTLGFTTGGTLRFTIDSSGTLVAHTPNYRLLVTEDDDIPNKGYVDNTVTGGASPTENVHTGVTTISGLDGTQVYLLHIYGVGDLKGTGIATLDGVFVRSGTSLGAGTILAQTGTRTINWHDGQQPIYLTIPVVMSGFTSLNVQTNRSSTGGVNTYSNKLIAVQITNN